jgi:hypothetical protein
MKQAGHGLSQRSRRSGSLLMLAGLKPLETRNHLAVTERASRLPPSALAQS